MERLLLLLADTLLVLHALIIVFNVGALPVIWIGYFRNWRLARNPYFRAGHLLLIAYIVAESVLGMACPLTTWESALRLKAGNDLRYEGGYLAYWLHQLFFYDLSSNAFLALYGLFFAVVLFTWIWVKPRLPGWWPAENSAKGNQ